MAFGVGRGRQAELGRPPVLPSSRGCSWQRGCMSAACLCVKCCSHVVIELSLFPLCHSFLFLPPFVFTQISFFASLLLRLVRQAGCPNSLSSALVCPPAAPGSFFSTCPRPRHTLCFLLYRSSSFQCKINTV